jgi:UTP--glucose-1-phosphate uridylyltransferase
MPENLVMTMFNWIEEAIRNKMVARGLAESRVESFLDNVRRMRRQSPYIPLDKVSAASDEFIFKIGRDRQQVAELESVGKSVLSKVVVIKLNGGRSTTMGGDVPKGVLEAKGGQSYLEIILRQVKAISETWQVDVPLVLMNSFFTHGPTMDVVSRFDVPVKTFGQTQVPRLLADTLAPMESGTDQDWVPPGHGDVYASLLESGLLERLLAEGYKWAFISNLDNLAASLEPWILGLVATHDLDFLLEVTDRTEADRKGGALVVRNGHLELLEIAQVDPIRQDEFMDIARFTVFNTNNVWIDLDALMKVLVDKSLDLPIIQNYKTVNGVVIVQLETAMGAAIGSFPRSKGLNVSRDRFFPTKKIEDLFVLQSDACVLDAMNRLKRNPARPESLPLMPTVTFDNVFLDSPLKISERFEDSSSISLVRANDLKVSGNVFFERDVRIEGNVLIETGAGETLIIPRGTVLAERRYP